MTPFDVIVKILEKFKWYKKKDESFWSHELNPGHSIGVQGTKFIHFDGNTVNQHIPIHVGFGEKALTSHLSEFHLSDKKKKKTTVC